MPPAEGEREVLAREAQEVLGRAAADRAEERVPVDLSLQLFQQFALRRRDGRSDPGHVAGESASASKRPPFRKTPPRMMLKSVFA